MRISLVASVLLLTATVPAAAQLSISINIGSYPEFMAVPGYPVYYAPDVGGNYFFYDGLYWVYQDDNWYSSSWYNGPWESVGPMYVPIYVLQIPVRYYQHPPQYFRGWQSDRPPHWNDHWGRNWAQRRQDWDRPQDRAHYSPAPLPDYQRRYSGRDYPRADQQQVIQQQNYRYHPRSVGDRQDSDKQKDERRPGTVRPNVREQPTMHEPGNAGAAARNSPDSGHDPEHKPHNDQPGRSEQRQDKNREQDKDHKHD
jgi:hypothetical protein